MKCIPTVIKYIETNKNKDIKNKTDTIGFLVIITDNPENKKNKKVPIDGRGIINIKTSFNNTIINIWFINWNKIFNKNLLVKFLILKGIKLDF